MKNFGLVVPIPDDATLKDYYVLYFITFSNSLAPNAVHYYLVFSGEGQIKFNYCYSITQYPTLHSPLPTEPNAAVEVLTLSRGYGGSE